MSKPPVDDTLGGMVYQVSCDPGYVLEFTGNQFEKMRCVCKFEQDGFVCRKSRYFESNLGLCVPGYSNGGGGVDGGSSSNKENNDTDSGQGIDFLDLSPEELVEMNIKRHKFSFFMRSLYDTFWYGNML